jgi:hypothetical protein
LQKGGSKNKNYFYLCAIIFISMKRKIYYWYLGWALVLVVVYFLFFAESDNKIPFISFAGILGGGMILNIIKWWNDNKFAKKTIIQCINKLNEGLPYLFFEKNIQITIDEHNKNQLIVRNAPLWIYRIKAEKPDEQLQLLIADFESLSKISAWKEFMTNKSLIFNLYSDETFEETIIKSEQKNYFA